MGFGKSVIYHQWCRRLLHHTTKDARRSCQWRKLRPWNVWPEPYTKSAFAENKF